MQKKIIALAVAAVASSAAFAQSNVTVYGIVDQALTETVQTGKLNSIGVTSGLSTSRIGFKGVEDLGNGTKALFTLEYGLTPNTASTIGSTDGAGSGGTSSRQTFVGLTGAYGTAVIGRLQTAGYDWAVKFDPLAGSAVSALQAVNYQASTGVLGATASTARANNAVAYIAPEIYGVTLAINHTVAAANTAGSGSDSSGVRGTLYSATYNNGPLSVGYVYETVAAETLGNAAKSTLAQALGASYDFGVAKLSATTQSQRDPQFGGDADKFTANSLSLAVPVSAVGTVVVSAGTKNAGVNAAGGSTDTTAQTLAYTHALSKRTTAYAALRQVTEKEYLAEGDRKTALIAAGIRHAF